MSVGPNELLTFEQRLSTLKSGLAPLQRVLALLEDQLVPPVLWTFPEGGRGYRYADPDLRHFCLIKGVRAVSAFHGCLVLAGGGFNQEIAVLVRTMIEYTRHIDFSLSGLFTDGQQTSEAKDFVAKFFSDALRGPGEQEKKPTTPQKLVHGVIAKDTKKLVGPEDQFDMEGAMWRTYRAFSNYVHGRYPEVMDMYGGRPGRFHIDGMRGTPKDEENLQILECYADTVALSIAHMVHGLGLKDVVRADVVAGPWFAERQRLAEQGTL